MSRYRTGRALGRTIYRDDRLIGVMDTAEDGALVVQLLNARERVLGAKVDHEAVGYQGKLAPGGPTPGPSNHGVTL